MEVARSEGDVKVCCSWTAAPADDDPKRATGRCCVWVRPTGRRPRSPTLLARETWKEGEALALANRAMALRLQWRAEIPPGVLYSTRRYEETMRLAFDRCGRLLRRPADLDWVERAQAALDIEAIEEDIADAEKELEERRRLTREREEALRAWDADPVYMDVAKETKKSRKRRVAQQVERLREDETLLDELVLRRGTRSRKKPKRFRFMND